MSCLFGSDICYPLRTAIHFKFACPRASTWKPHNLVHRSTLYKAVGFISTTTSGQTKLRLVLLLQRRMRNLFLAGGGLAQLVLLLQRRMRNFLLLQRWMRNLFIAASMIFTPSSTTVIPKGCGIHLVASKMDAEFISRCVNDLHSIVDNSDSKGGVPPV